MKYSSSLLLIRKIHFFKQRLNHDNQKICLFTKRKVFRLVQIESIYKHDDIYSTKKFEICYGNEKKKHCGEKEKMLVTSIFLRLPQCFQKAVSAGSLKAGIVW